MSSKLFLLRGIVCLFALVGGVSAQDDVAVYAVVNGVDIPQAEVETAMRLEARRRFYHGRVEQDRLDELRQDVFQRMVDRVLLLEEARSRKIEAESGRLDLRLQEALKQYKLSDLAEAQRNSLESALRHQLGEEMVLESLKQQVQLKKAPDEAELERYYQNNLDKFTTPEQLKLSVILLRVQPSAPLSAWEAAQREAEEIRLRIERGASFAELAAIHSADDSAERGGDLGFVHQGMLSSEAQVAVDLLQAGQMSPVVTLLQGIALFKLEARRAAVVNTIEDVRARLEGLWQRDDAAQRWEALLLRLRAGAQIVVNENIGP